MRYDIELFQELNDEYRCKPLKSSFVQYDPDSQFALARSHVARLEKVKSPENESVLEVGCGLGYLSCVLASDYSCSVIGTDIKRATEWELLKTTSPDLEYMVVDLTSGNPFAAASFDWVVSFATWEHIIHPFTLLRECCKVLNESGLMYIVANLYRSPTASHRYREIFFPFSHLLFEDEVFSEYYTKHTGTSMTPARLNKLTYSQYREYFRILNLQVEHEELRRVPLDREFYNRFREKLERYPIFDLELDYFRVLLRRAQCKSECPVAERSLAERKKVDSELEALVNSFSLQLGQILVQAVRWPGRNTVLFPYRLVRLCLRELRKRRRSNHF